MAAGGLAEQGRKQKGEKRRSVHHVAHKHKRHTEKRHKKSLHDDGRVVVVVVKGNEMIYDEGKNPPEIKWPSSIGASPD